MTTRPTGRTIILTDGGTVAFSAALAIYDGTPIGLPAPTPAPVFTVAPSIGSDGTPQVGETLTGSDGTITNGAVSARQWLLNGTAISGATGATYVPTQVGAHSYRVTATGLGGERVATSGVVSVAAATVTPSPTITISAAQAKAEGNTGSTMFTYTVTRSTAIGAVNVPWSFLPGATSVDDFAGGVYPAGGAVALIDGQASGTITISINGDTTAELDETFSVLISTPAGYVAGTATSATGTVLNDDLTVGFKSLGMVGVNIADELAGGPLPPMFIDHSKASGNWVSISGPMTLNADYYPQSAPNGAKVQVPMDAHGAKPGSDQTMIADFTDTNLNVIIGGGNIISSQVVGGRLRIEYTYNLAVMDQYWDGHRVEFEVRNISATSFARPADGQLPPFRTFLKSEEGRLNAGKLIRQHFIDSHVDYDFLRPMSMSHVVGSGGEITSHAQHTKMTSAQWHSTNNGDLKGIPLAVQCAMANECNTNLWVNVPFAYTDQACRDYAAEIRRGAFPLASHLRTFIEIGNECSGWNYRAPFDVGTIYFEQAYDPVIVSNAEGGITTANYGYRATQMMAVMMKAEGWTEQFLPFLGGQNLADYITRGILSGADVAVAEFKNPSAVARPYRRFNNATQQYDVRGTSGGYDAEIAAHVPEIGALLTGGLGGAAYEFGGIADSMLEVDKTTVRSWPTDPNGYQKLYDLIVHGTGLSKPYPCLDDLPQRFAANTAELKARGIQQRNYELQLETDQEIGISNWLWGFYDIDLCRQLLAEHYGPQLLAGGIIGWAVLCDTFGQTYGNMKGAFDLDAPRRQGWLACKALAATIPPLSVTTTTTGVMRVGNDAVTRITVENAVGVPKVEVLNVAAGRTYDGFRTVKGTITAAAGNQPGIIRVTDERGTTEWPLPQNVLAAPTYPSGRFLRVQFQESAPNDGRGGYIDLDYVGGRDQSGADKAGTWTGDNDRAPSLSAADGQTYFAGPVNPDYGVVVNAKGDFGTIGQFSAIVVKHAGNSRAAPGRWKAWLSSTSGGAETLILDVNEPNDSAWVASALRVFEVGGT